MAVASPVAARYGKPVRRARGGKQAELSAVDLKLRTFWNALKAETTALPLLCLYVLFEYIRPQDMYEVIDVIPWGLTTIVLATLGALTVQGGAKGLNILDGLFFLFMLVLSLSMFTAYNSTEATKDWTIAGTMALLYFCVRATLNTPNRLLVFSIFFLIINLKYSQFATRAFIARGGSFANFGVSGSGLLKNSGELAMQMGIVFFISLCVLLALRPYVKNRRRWWALLALFPGTMLITVVASSSRGGQLALIVVLVLMLIKPPQLLRKLASLVAVVALLAVILPQEQIDRFRSAGDDGTSQSRMKYWGIGQQILEDNPGGIGFRNWTVYYGSFHWDKKVFPRLEVSHNSYLDAFVELGYQGGFLFLSMVATTVIMNLRTQARLKHVPGRASAVTRGVARGVNLGFVSSCIAGFFMSVLYYPMFWMAFAMTSAAYQISLAVVKERQPTASARAVPPRRLSALRPLAAPLESTP